LPLNLTRRVDRDRLKRRTFDHGSGGQIEPGPMAWTLDDEAIKIALAERALFMGTVPVESV
jgi:hypothetical protein